MRHATYCGLPLIHKLKQRFFPPPFSPPSDRMQAPLFSPRSRAPLLFDCKHPLSICSTAPATCSLLFSILTSLPQPLRPFHSTALALSLVAVRHLTWSFFACCCSFSTPPPETQALGAPLLPAPSEPAPAISAFSTLLHHPSPHGRYYGVAQADAAL